MATCSSVLWVVEFLAVKKLTLCSDCILSETRMLVEDTGNMGTDVRFDNMLQGFRLILVQPMYAGNVGSIARLATNYALEDVFVADSRCNFLDEEAKLYARGHSLQRLHSFQKVPTLEQAQGNCAFSVGFSRRRGDLRNPNITLDEIYDLSCQAKTALVFGCEESGLSNDHLLLCTHICSLPTADIMPSLNLSHAVAVVVARMFQMHFEGRQNVMGTLPPAHFSPGGKLLQARLSKTMRRLLSPISLSNFEVLMAHFRTVMVLSGLTMQGNPERMLAEVRRILQRASLAEREANVLHGVLSAVERTLRNAKSPNENFE